ncbi:O-Methyltransferase involved in polyketide biosynthesis [Lachnospiraceae bacterium]|nr:O-Methyltransferase involved in polyketide biosynthesis [Lachnospiraceae bacterium]
MDITLGDVQTTALIPLAIKANETKRSNARVKDRKATEIIEKLGVDTEPYDKFMSHEGVIARTIMLDRQLRNIIKENPDTVVVNIAAGFDNRFERVDNGQILWFDIDLPDVIAVRKKAFEERERVQMIAGNVLQDGWCAVVKKALAGRRSRPVFLAEGLFMYLTMDEIQKFLSVLKSNFAEGVLIAEQNDIILVKQGKHHDTVRNTAATFKSGTKSGHEIEELVDGIRLVDEHSFNEEMKKYSVRAKIFAFLFPSLNDRWATFEW